MNTQTVCASKVDHLHMMAVGAMKNHTFYVRLANLRDMPMVNALYDEASCDADCSRFHDCINASTTTEDCQVREVVLVLCTNGPQWSEHIIGALTLRTYNDVNQTSLKQDFPELMQDVSRLGSDCTFMSKLAIEKDWQQVDDLVFLLIKEVIEQGFKYHFSQLVCAVSPKYCQFYQQCLAMYEVENSQSEMGTEKSPAVVLLGKFTAVSWHFQSFLRDRRTNNIRPNWI